MVAAPKIYGEDQAIVRSKGGLTDLSPKFHPVESRIRSSLLRDRTLDHPELEFPGLVMMAGWICHRTEAI